MNKGRIAVLFFLLVSTIGAFLIYYFIQPVVTYSDCTLCDGNHYLAMYHYFKGNLSHYQEAFPYYSRIVVPVLASLIPWKDALLSFQLINLIFSILSVITIYYLWKKLEIPAYLIFIGLFWFLFHWTGLIRLNAFDPYTVDVPTYFFQALFIWIFLTRKFRLLWILGPVAILQRESITVLLIVLLIFSFVHNKIQQKEENIPLSTIIIALVLSIAVKYLFTLKFPPVDTDKSSVRLVLFYIREILIDPLKIVRWMVGIFMAYGALLLLALQNVRKNYFSSSFMNFIAIMSLTYILLALIAGVDNTRIAFLGFPFVMTWILFVLKEVSWKLISIALLCSGILMKLASSIPDQGKDFSAFASWYPEFAEIGVVAGWGIYGIFCFLFLFGANRFINLSEKNSNRS